MSHIPTRGNCQNLTFTKLQKFLPTHPWQPITTIWTFKGVDLFKPETSRQRWLNRGLIIKTWKWRLNYNEKSGRSVWPVSVSRHHVSKPSVLGDVLTRFGFYSLVFVTEHSGEITYLISYHWNTATLFVQTYGRWIFYLFCFWIIVFCPVCWSSLSLCRSLECCRVASPVWPGQYQYAPDWHHARQGYAGLWLAHPWPCQSFK